MNTKPDSKNRFQRHSAVSMKHKGSESEMERGLTNGFAVKESNWNDRDLNFLHWKALSDHLATDVDCPQKVRAYRANSCYANGAEGDVWEAEDFLLQGAAWSRIHRKASPHAVVFFFSRVFFIEKFNFSPAEARAVNR